MATTAKKQDPFVWEGKDSKGQKTQGEPWVRVLLW